MKKTSRNDLNKFDKKYRFQFISLMSVLVLHRKFVISSNFLFKMVRDSIVKKLTVLNTELNYGNTVRFSNIISKLFKKS